MDCVDSRPDREKTHNSCWKEEYSSELLSAWPVAVPIAECSVSFFVTNAYSADEVALLANIAAVVANIAVVVADIAYASAALVAEFAAVESVVVAGTTPLGDDMTLLHKERT